MQTTNMPFIQPRFLFLAIALACLGLIGTAVYIEPFASMDACPMCMMQRWVYAMIASVAVLAAIHNPAVIGQRIYAVLTGIFALVGAGIAGRQIWLQSLPEDQVPACGPGIDYMLEVFPLLEVIEMSIRGTGDCAKVQWTFLNLSIPGWALIAFISIVVTSLIIIFKKRYK